MPSWNVHTAHVERLFSEGPLSAFGIRDANAFLFGNYVPDIHIGYMVAHPTGILPYRLTHFADAHVVPIPREQEFWDTYVEPVLAPAADVPMSPALGMKVEESSRLNKQLVDYQVPATPAEHERVEALLASSDYRASDVVLGAWAHLACDNVYNTATRAWFESHGIQAGEDARVRKQDDFLKYGETLDLRLTCTVTPELIGQAAAFPQYAVCEADVRASVEAAAAIVADNQANHIDGVPDYSFFTPEFFREVSDAADALIRERLRAYAERHNS